MTIRSMILLFHPRVNLVDKAITSQEAALISGGRGTGDDRLFGGAGRIGWWANPAMIF